MCAIKNLISSIIPTFPRQIFAYRWLIWETFQRITALLSMFMNNFPIDMKLKVASLFVFHSINMLRNMRWWNT